MIDVGDEPSGIGEYLVYVTVARARFAVVSDWVAGRH